MKVIIKRMEPGYLGKMVRVVAFLICLIHANGLSAQFFIHGDAIFLQSGAKLVINDSLRVKKAGSLDAKIHNEGKIVLAGDMKMQPGTQISGDGNFCFSGASFQSLKMNGIALPKLEILNDDSVLLGDDLNITDSLILGNGHLILGNNDLIVGSSVVLDGGSSSSYIRVNGTGKVKATVGSSPFMIPIGRNPYLPVVIDDGGGEEYSVGVSEGVYADPENSTTLQTTNVVGEIWTIQSSGSQSNVSVTLQWESAEEESGFNRSNSNLAFWEDGVSSVWDQGSAGLASGSGPYSMTRTVNFTTNLFYFGVGSSGSALPVELSYFTAEWQEQGKTAQLNWQTAQEINNSHFEVQRSFDGTVWEHIGQVEGQGTSMSVHSYQFTDKSSQFTVHRQR